MADTAGVAGTGTPGANQDFAAVSPNTTPARTPGEVLTVGQQKSFSAPVPKVSNDMVLLFAQQAFDLAVKKPLRDKMIWDQFASVSVSEGGAVNGKSVRKFFGDDIDPTGADVPLLENVDVDSVAFAGRGVDCTLREYGRAVSRTRLAQVISKINIDPMIVDRVAYDASRAQDLLAKTAFTTGVTSGISYVLPDGTTQASVPASLTVGTAATDFLSTTSLQVAIATLEAKNVLPYRNGNYILLVGPVGAQHLKNERDTGGFRYVTARNEGAAGNSIYRGTIGMVEGAEIVVSNTVPAGHAYLIGQDAFMKAHANQEGYGAMPATVVAPQIDKLKRFLSWGWLHYVGYSLFDTRAIVHIPISTAFRPEGAAGASTIDLAVTAVTGW
jgi:hypothetical protein